MLGAAKRTLDGEDRSEMIAEEGKAGRKIGEKWSAILVPSPAASNMVTKRIAIAWGPRPAAGAKPARRKLRTHGADADSCCFNPRAPLDWPARPRIEPLELGKRKAAALVARPLG